MNEEQNQASEVAIESNETVDTEPQTDEGNTTEKSEETNEVLDQQEQVESTYTQEQVNDIVRDRLDRDRKNLYTRYGVEDKTGLDELIEKALSYDVMMERLEKSQQEQKTLAEELAFIRKNINPERKDDIKAYFKGKELEFNEDALEKELTTHPEWLNVVKDDPLPKTTITKISADRGEKVEENEKDRVAKLFGMEKLL